MFEMGNNFDKIFIRIKISQSFIIEDPTATVKCRIAIQVLFLYFNL